MLKLILNNNNEYRLQDLSTAKSGDLNKYQQVSNQLKENNILFSEIDLNDDATVTISLPSWNTNDIAGIPKVIIGNIIDTGIDGYYQIAYTTLPSMDITRYQTYSYAYNLLDADLKSMYDTVITNLLDDDDYKDKLPYFSYILGASISGYVLSVNPTYDQNLIDESNFFSTAQYIFALYASYAYITQLNSVDPTVSTNLLGVTHIIIHNDIINNYIIMDVKEMEKVTLLLGRIREILNDQISYRTFDEALTGKNIAEFIEWSEGDKGIINDFIMEVAGDIGTNTKEQIQIWYDWAAEAILEKQIDPDMTEEEYEEETTKIMDLFNQNYEGFSKDLSRLIIDDYSSLSNGGTLTIITPVEGYTGLDGTSSNTIDRMVTLSRTDQVTPTTDKIFLLMHGTPTITNTFNYPKAQATIIYESLKKGGMVGDDFLNLKELEIANCYSGSIVAEQIILEFNEILRIEEGMSNFPTISYIAGSGESNTSFPINSDDALRNTTIEFRRNNFYAISNDLELHINEHLYNIDPEEYMEYSLNGAPPSILQDLNNNTPYQQLAIDCGFNQTGTVDYNSLTEDDIALMNGNYRRCANSNLVLSKIVDAGNPGEDEITESSNSKLYKSILENNICSNNYEHSGDRDVYHTVLEKNRTMRETIVSVTQKLNTTTIKNGEEGLSIREKCDLISESFKLQPKSKYSETINALADYFKIPEESRPYFNQKMNENALVNTPEDIRDYFGYDVERYVNGMFPNAEHPSPISATDIIRDMATTRGEEVLSVNRNNINVLSAPIGRESGIDISVSGDNKEEINTSINTNETNLNNAYIKEGINLSDKQNILNDKESLEELRKEVNEDRVPTTFEKNLETTARYCEHVGKALNYYGLIIGAEGDFSFEIDFSDPESIGAFCDTIGFMEGAIQIGIDLGISGYKRFMLKDKQSRKAFDKKIERSMQNMEIFAAGLDAILTIGSCYAIFSTLDKNSDDYGVMIAMGVVDIANYIIELAQVFAHGHPVVEAALAVVGVVLGVISTILGAVCDIIGLDDFSAGEKCKDFFLALFGIDWSEELDNTRENMWDTIRDSIMPSVSFTTIVCSYGNDDLMGWDERDGGDTIQNDESREMHNNFNQDITWDEVKAMSNDSGNQVIYVHSDYSSDRNGVAIALGRTGYSTTDIKTIDFSNCDQPVFYFANYIANAVRYASQDSDAHRSNEIITEFNSSYCYSPVAKIKLSYGTTNFFVITDDVDDITAVTAGYSTDTHTSGMPANYYPYWLSKYYFIKTADPSNIDTVSQLILEVAALTDVLTFDLTTPTMNFLSGPYSNPGSVPTPDSRFVKTNAYFEAYENDGTTLSTDFSIINRIFLNKGSTVVTHGKSLLVTTRNYATINALNQNPDETLAIYAGFSDTININGTTDTLQVMI